jgi:hypothetical protein
LKANRFKTMYGFASELYIGHEDLRTMAGGGLRALDTEGICKIEDFLKQQKDQKLANRIWVCGRFVGWWDEAEGT